LVHTAAPKFSFGIGHEMLVNENVPGPGTYNDSILEKHHGPNVVMAGKLERKYDTVSPGPQAYQIQSQTARGGFSFVTSK